MNTDVFDVAILIALAGTVFLLYDSTFTLISSSASDGFFCEDLHEATREARPSSLFRVSSFNYAPTSRTAN